MNTETINTQLYEKMFAEQERYRDWLLHQPPEEILNHAYEYAIREDILMALESRDLSFMQAQMLIFTATPLADILKEFDNRETDHMYTASLHSIQDGVSWVESSPYCEMSRNVQYICWS